MLKPGTLSYLIVACCVTSAVLLTACQTTQQPKLKPEEQRALHALLSGSAPKDRDVELAITGDGAALHRVFLRSATVRLDSDALEAQCYYLLRLLFSLGDHGFADALRKESPAVRARVVLLIRDSFRQLGYPRTYPETESVAPNVPVYRAEGSHTRPHEQ